MIAAAPDHHVYLPNANILGILPNTDLLIADVSSVTLDQLYLAPGAPILLTDRRSDPAQLLADSPMSAACTIVDRDSANEIARLIRESLSHDTHASAREQMRTYYFGDSARSSTENFWEAITTEISAHDTALKQIARVRQVRS